MSKKRCKRTMKKVGGFSGIFDSFSHSMSSREANALHVQMLEDELSDKIEQRNRMKQDYNEKIDRAKYLRQQQAEILKEEEAQRRQEYQQDKLINSQEAEKGAEAAAYTWSEFWKGIKNIGHLGKNFITGINGMLGNKMLTTVTDRVMILICSVLFILCLIALIVLIVYVVKGFEDEKTEEEKKKEGNPDSKTPTMILNIQTYSDALNKGLHEHIPRELAQFVKSISNYETAATWIDSNDPVKYFYNILNKFYEDVVLNDTTRQIIRNLTYMYYSLLYYASKFTGSTGNMPETLPRNTVPYRNNNITNLQSSIFPLDLMRSKQIDSNDNIIINLLTPNNITWELKESDYATLDLGKVPPSLRKLQDKDNNNMTLEDKKQIIIPWIVKDNNYVLSCQDAYFKNNPSEKVNLFQDDYENNNCRYDTSENSTSKVYDIIKTRKIQTTDLRMFL
jgi:hypothetical protein